LSCEVSNRIGVIMRISRNSAYLSLVTANLLFGVSTFAAVTVSSPESGATVGASVHFVATGTTTSCASGVASMGIYVNNQLTYIVVGTSLDTSLSLNQGTYNTVVEEWDYCGGATYTSISITVASPSGVLVSSPENNGTFTSPVTYTASANSSTCAQGVASMGIYVNDKLTYTVNDASLNTTLTLSPGTYNTVVEEWDNCGGASFTPVEITVVNQTGVFVSAPAAGGTVTSPVTYTASATTTACAQGVASMGIYVNNTIGYVTSGSELDTQMTLGPGAQHTVVEEWDRCGGASYATVNLTVSAAKAVTGVAVSPNPVTVPMGTTQQFAATATYSDGSTANVTATASWSVANTAVATINGSGLASLAASGATMVTATQDGVNGSSQLTATIPLSSLVNVPTWHVDTNRSGLNANEVSLSSANVSPGTFGKLFSYLVDGYVYGEPLLMSNVNINGSVQNVVYAATEHDSVYAFDADNFGSGAPLWQVSLLQAGETPMTDGPIQPYQGVTSTPVIDPSTNTIYVISAQLSTSTGDTTFRLNALDITTGAQKFGAPVTINASVPATNSDAVNDIETLTNACLQRAALLLANNSIYMGFGSCHSGWLLAYNAQTLAQTGVFNASPNLNGEGPYGSAGGVWMGSGGPVADSAGNIYVTTGNGPWDGNTAFGDSVLKFNATLQLEDYFTADDYAYMNCADKDLAAGGLMLIPGTTLAVAGGKPGKLYLVNTSNLGKEQANDAGATQTLWFEGGISAPYASSCSDASGTHTADISAYEIFGTSAYFNGSVYLGMTPTVSDVPAGIREFPFSGTALSWGPYTSPSVEENTRGTTPFISANGTAGAVLWMIDTGQPLQNSGNDGPTNAILRAYDAKNLSHALYNSAVNPGDQPGYGIKFSSPVVGNGKVYISTGHDVTTVANPQGEIDVYGLN
jgi:Bacterial Ig-like domain (group 2)